MLAAIAFSVFTGLILAGGEVSCEIDVSPGDADVVFPPSGQSSDFAAHLCLPVLRALRRRDPSGTGARVGMNLLGRKRLTAFGAHHYRIEVLAAFAVLMQ